MYLNSSSAIAAAAAVVAVSAVIVLTIQYLMFELISILNNFSELHIQQVQIRAFQSLHQTLKQHPVTCTLAISEIMAN